MVKNYQDLSTILTDSDYERDMRLVRLQGFRGDDAELALQSTIGGRLGPAVCGAGAILGVLLASPLLLGLLALASLIGVFAANHPVEVGYNALARRRGSAQVPSNTAGRRLGCFIGMLFLGGAAVAYAFDAIVLGAVLGLSIGFLALFVAITNICVPSIVFTLLRGVERTQIRSFFPALFAEKSEKSEEPVAPTT